MTLKLDPKIAVFCTDDNGRKNLEKLKASYSLTEVRCYSTHEVIEESYKAESLFDLLVFFVSEDSIDHTTAVLSDCSQQEIISSIPKVAISSSQTSLDQLNDKQVDAKLLFDSEISLAAKLLDCLTVRKRAFDVQIRNIASSIDLKDYYRENFYSGAHPNIIFDDNGNVSAVNTAAKILLNVEEDQIDDEASKSAAKALLEFFKAGKNISESELSSHGIECSGELRLKRADGISVEVSAKIIPVASMSGGTRYHSFLIPSAKDKGAQSLAVQSVRERAFLLTCAASHFDTFRSQGSLLGRYEQTAANTPSPCQLKDVVDKLLEMLDPIIDPSIEIKLKVDSQIVIPTRQSDAFKLFAHLLLMASDFLASSGSITMLSNDNNQIDIIAESPHVIKRKESDQAFIRAFHPVTLAAYKANLGAVERIAEEYELNLEISQPMPNQFRGRVSWQL